MLHKIVICIITALLLSVYFQNCKCTILMVTHDPFSASFCERILFLKDGKIFNEIFRGEKSRKDFFNEILDILTLLGGEVGNVR